MDEVRTGYAVLVFLGACGVLQIAAAHAGLRGLLFLRSRVLSTLLGVGLIGGGLFWFFGPGPRHIPDTAGGLDGNAQGAYFAVSALAAVVSTLLLSSLLNRGRFPGTDAPDSGLDALRYGTYLDAFPSGVRDLLREGREWIQRRSSG